MRKSFKIASLAAVLAACAVQVAHARPDTRTMTCSQAQQLVQRHGSVVMSTGRHTFGRFVSHGRFCYLGEAPFREYVPTRDNRNCPIGYECRDPRLFLLGD